MYETLKPPKQSHFTIIQSIYIGHSKEPTWRATAISTVLDQDNLYKIKQSVTFVQYLGCVQFLFQ